MTAESLHRSTAALGRKLSLAFVALLALAGVAQAQIDIDRVYADPDELGLPLTNTTVYAVASSSIEAELFYQWSTVSNAGPVVFDAPTNAVSGVTLGGVGEYVLRVTISDDQANSVDVDLPLTVGSNLTYTVTFDANGATGGTAPSPQLKTYNVPLTLSSNVGNLVKTSATFGGWNTAPDGSGDNYSEGGSYTNNASVTLYANWNGNAGSLVPNNLFSDYMVLQRRARVPIWGTDTPGTTVTVNFRGQSQSAVTAANGKWMVYLDPMEHGGPFTMTISNSLGNSVNRYDVLVGDVFLGSGQSNMEWAAASASADGSTPITTYGTNNVDADTMAVIDQAVANPNIRISSWTRDHLITPNKGWSRVLASQRLITPALPVCIVQKMQVAQGIPMGVIVRAESGTSMIRWIVGADFNNDPVIIAEKEDLSDGTPTATDPVGDLWTKYIAPTVPYAIRGFLWDQGEWGIGYRGVTWTGAMHALLDSWRARFGQGDLPWTCTSHYDYTLQTTLADVGTPMVVIANTWGLSGALHPLNKDEYADKHVEEFMPIVYGGVPVPWYVSDVGATGLAGFEMKYSTQFVLTSTGGGIGGTADSLRFMNQGANGDCQIVVRMHGMLNASPDAKAGIMIRDALDPEAPAVGVWLTPTVSTPNTTNPWSANVAATYRSSAGGTTTAGATATLSPTYPDEFWLRLARLGNDFNADYSTNGVNWMPLGPPVTVNMSPDVYLGAGVCSGQANVPLSATFYQVAVDMQPDQTPPTLTSIDDGDADDTVAGGDWLNYTVTFNEDIDASTVTTADFDNAGTASVLFDTVVKTGSGVFTVPVRPMTEGSLILRIHTNAVIADVKGNFLAVPVQDDTTVTVVGDAPGYPVAYNANGAHSGTAPPSQSKTNGLPLTLALNSGNLAKTDAVFAGWNTKADGTGATYLAGSTYNIDAPVTLYARWVPLTPEGAFEIYVTTTGSDANAGGSWSEALLKVSTAIARAKDALTQSATSAVIYVGTGTFASGGQLLLDQPIAVVGGTQNPGQASVVQGNGVNGNYRVFRLTHAGARLEGLTIQNGYSSATSSPDPGRGGNVLMSAGVVTNCLIRNAYVRDGSRQGGGLYMSGGIVEDCTINNNYVWITSLNQTGFGGGVYMAGGELRRCRVNANYFSIGSSSPGSINCYGGGVYVNHAGAVVESCLIDGNYSPNDGTANSAGGGVYLASGTVRNCTVVKNSCRKTTITHTGGGLRQAGGTLLNTIIWSNTVGTSTVANYWDGGTARDVTYSCATELAGGTGNIAADPLFVAPASGDYRVPAESPCVDTGLNDAWMSTAQDLDGEPRLQGALVDMGAYETSGGVLSITSIGANPATMTLPASTSTVYVVAVSMSNAPLTYAWSQVSGAGTAVFDTPAASNSVVTFSTNAVYGLQVVVNDNLGNSVTGSVPVTVNAPLVTYTVSYDANGADSGSAPGAQAKTNGVPLTLAGNTGSLVKSNYTFSGWNTSADGLGTSYAAGGSYTDDAPVTLYAQWLFGSSSVLFVATTGSDANGGTTWADACLTITNAVAKAKDAITNGGAPNAVIYVGTGTFTSRAEVLLDQPIVLIGGTQNPGQASVIAGQGSTGNYRVFRLTHASAVLDSLTISNGYSGSTSTPNAGTGGNIRMSAGLVTNCVIRNATIRDGSRFGGGLFMSGGLVVGCTISANNNWDTSRDTAAYGGGVYMTGGELRNSRVNANYFSIGSSAPATITCYGAGVYVANSSAVVESCLIDSNYAPNNGTANSAGGGVYVTSGTVRNCTIVNNRVLKTGLVNPVGGVRQAGGTVLNSIIWSNTISGTVTAGNYYDGGTAKAVTNSCAPELNGIDGNISAYPQFIAPGSGNFRLAAGGSPCVDAGLDEAWMGGATDLDGNARLQGGHVDMGAYETAGTSSVPGPITDGALTGGTNISFTVNGSGSLVVQVSTNLANAAGWVDLLTNTAPFSFTDTNAVNTHPLRFYRTKAP